jgi:hypothetical protein
MHVALPGGVAEEGNRHPYHELSWVLYTAEVHFETYHDFVKVPFIGQPEVLSHLSFWTSGMDKLSDIVNA